MNLREKDNLRRKDKSGVLKVSFLRRFHCREGYACYCCGMPWSPGLLHIYCSCFSTFWHCHSYILPNFNGTLVSLIFLYTSLQIRSAWGADFSRGYFTPTCIYARHGCACVSLVTTNTHTQSEWQGSKVHYGGPEGSFHAIVNWNMVTEVHNHNGNSQWKICVLASRSACHMRKHGCSCRTRHLILQLAL